VKACKTLLAVTAFIFMVMPATQAQNSTFHNAPASAAQMKSPLTTDAKTTEIGGQLFVVNCSTCHGPQGQGSGNVPALKSEKVQGASEGELFWFITQGSVDNGMPSWASISEERRWQLVMYLKAGLPPIPRNQNSPDMDAKALSAPPPVAPYTDFRYEKPGTFRKITLQDMPAPFTTGSSGNGAKLVPRPEGAMPKVLPGFKVDLYATGLHGPRLIRTAPNGDYFVSEGVAGDIKVFRGISGDSKPVQSETFASGLTRPYGIAFYPPGPNPQWVYVGDTNAIVRIPYQNGDLKARGPCRTHRGPAAGWPLDARRGVLSRRQEIIRLGRIEFERR
jgi:mono/diheme cytochrome c family protein